MSVLVTGAGLVGGEIARLLARDGRRFVLVDRDAVPELAAELGDAARIERVDVADFAALRALVRDARISRIVHTAGMLSAGARREPLAAVQSNIIGSANMLELARTEALQRVVIASSSTVTYSVFGSFVGAAIPEDFGIRVISERPRSLYAATKLAVEHLALVYAETHGVDAVVLRFGAVLGPCDARGGGLPSRLLGALFASSRSGETTRIDDPLLAWEGVEEFVDSRDCAAAALAALDAPAPSACVYNVGTGMTHSFEDVVAAAKSVCPGLRVALAASPRGGFAGFAHQRPAPSDVSAARRELGFEARYSLADSMRRFYQTLQ